MPAGRPTDYRAEYNEQAYKLCLLGHTNPELAIFFDVAESTIDLWIKTHEEFSGAVKRGRVIADSEVAHSFLKRAKGYEYEEKEYKDARLVKVIKKEMPPDAGAALNWLKNRQPKKWRDKQEHGFTDEEGKDIKPVINIYNSAPPMAFNESDIVE